jgi:hypothetical protein
VPLGGSPVWSVGSPDVQEKGKWYVEKGLFWVCLHWTAVEVPDLNLPVCPIGSLHWSPLYNIIVIGRFHGTVEEHLLARLSDAVKLHFPTLVLNGPQNN